MNSSELAFASAWELRELIAKGEISPVELVELFLERIERLNSKLNAYLTLASDQARKDAMEAEKAVKEGRKLGLLHGVPISIKDLEITKNLRTTFGSLVFRDYTPDKDSLVVARLREAGAIILGKTNTPELGCAGTTSNRLGDHCRNPWDLNRTPGGSSGGAGAALAAGLCPLALGSDGGGSIRIPSSFSGVYGLKPTLGRIPRVGGVGKPVANYLSVVGPMSRTVKDSALLLQATSGYHSSDPLSIMTEPPDYFSTLDEGVRGLRMAWSPDLGYAPADPEVERIASEAVSVFRDLGCKMDEAKLKIEDPAAAFLTIFGGSLYSSMGHFYEEHKDLFTEYAAEVFEVASRARPEDLPRALYVLESLKSKMALAMKDYDLVLTPTMPVPAFPIGSPPTSIAGREINPHWGWLQFTFPINMMGLPAASVPCGFSADGMPIGLQIIGRWNEEHMVLKASAAFERVKPWADRRSRIS